MPKSLGQRTPYLASGFPDRPAGVTSSAPMGSRAGAAYIPVDHSRSRYNICWPDNWTLFVPSLFGLGLVQQCCHCYFCAISFIIALNRSVLKSAIAANFVFTLRLKVVVINPWFGYFLLFHYVQLVWGKVCRFVFFVYSYFNFETLLYLLRIICNQSTVLALIFSINVLGWKCFKYNEIA